MIENGQRDYIGIRFRSNKGNRIQIIPMEFVAAISSASSDVGSEACQSLSKRDFCLIHVWTERRTEKQIVQPVVDAISSDLAKISRH